MNHIKGIFRLHWFDTRFSYLMFWSIFTAVCIALIILLRNVVQEGNINIGLGIAVIIYLAIHGIISIKETLPYAVGLGYTRHQYAQNTIVFFILLALATAVVQRVFILITEFFAGLFNITGNLFLTLDRFSNGEGFWLVSLLLDFSAALIIVSLALCITMVYFRLGKLVLYIMAGLVFILIMFFSIQPHLLIDLINLLMFTSWEYSLMIYSGVLALIFFSLFYVLTQRIEMLAFRK